MGRHIPHIKRLADKVQSDEDMMIVVSKLLNSYEFEPDTRWQMIIEEAREFIQHIVGEIQDYEQ